MVKCIEKTLARSFEDFIRDYFLEEKSITLKIHGHKVPLLPFEVSFLLSYRNPWELRSQNANKSPLLLTFRKFISSSMIRRNLRSIYLPWVAGSAPPRETLKFQGLLNLTTWHLSTTLEPDARVSRFCQPWRRK